ncbi:sigma factor [Streptomyces sp. NPDC001796]|uniref:sigma factor n=1 Tax=Streptomyces sp. NPDC001796 TaxID=3364609 RepID=UPI0036D0C4C6
MRRLTSQMYAMTGSLTEAEDLVQEAFARAWQNPFLRRLCHAPSRGALTPRCRPLKVKDIARPASAGEGTAGCQGRQARDGRGAAAAPRPADSQVLAAVRTGCTAEAPADERRLTASVRVRTPRPETAPDAVSLPAPPSDSLTAGWSRRIRRPPEVRHRWWPRPGRS